MFEMVALPWRFSSHHSGVYSISHLSYACYISCPCHRSGSNYCNNINLQVQIMTSLSMKFHPFVFLVYLFGQNICQSTLIVVITVAIVFLRCCKLCFVSVSFCWLGAVCGICCVVCFCTVMHVFLCTSNGFSLCCNEWGNNRTMDNTISLSPIDVLLHVGVCIGLFSIMGTWAGNNNNNNNNNNNSNNSSNNNNVFIIVFANNKKAWTVER
jgi:hypothetical protein